MQEKLVRSPGWEDPLEKKMATIPLFLPGKSDGQESLTDYSPWGHKRVRHDLATKQQQKSIATLIVSLEELIFFFRF